VTGPVAPLAVLFDLDGTLLDTAPDMLGALNELLAEHNSAPVPWAAGRAQVSNGSSGLLKLAFPEAGERRRSELQQRFLALYAARLAEQTALFEGMAEVLEQLEYRTIAWGVVTNKPGWLTEPLLAALSLKHRAGCIVSGDTLPLKKPHPAPLLHATGLLQVAAERAIYVGDAPRDIEAGRAAGMPTVLARYGYLSAAELAADLGADHVIEQPTDLLGYPGLARE